MVNTQPAQNPYELKKFWSSMQWFGQCQRSMVNALEKGPSKSSIRFFRETDLKKSLPFPPPPELKFFTSN